MQPGPVLLCVGAACLLVAVVARWYSRWRARRVLEWPNAPALITSTDIIDAGSGVMRYMPWVTYAYQVDGKSFEGDRLRLGGRTRFSRRAEALAYLAAFPVRGTVNARHHPRRPALALLDEKPQSYVFSVFLIFAALYGGLGLLLLVIPQS